MQTPSLSIFPADPLIKCSCPRAWPLRFVHLSGVATYREGDFHHMLLRYAPFNVMQPPNPTLPNVNDQLVVPLVCLLEVTFHPLPVF